MAGLCSSPLFLACTILAVFLAPRVTVAVTPGTLRWTYPIDSASWSSIVVLGPDGTLYAATDDGLMYAISTVYSSSSAPGSLKWKFST
jgi:outer membrane protein assembly factor BamB